MPEGPEVRKVGDVIKRGIGQIFSKIEIIEQPHFKHRYVREGIPEIHHFQDQFTITDVMVSGKLIDICLDNGKEKFDVLNTLGMSGTWAWGSKSHKHARINFVSGDPNWQDLTFIDQRCFGTFKLVQPAVAWDKHLTIGCDLLDNPVRDDAWAGFQKHPSITNKQIGIVLMGQKYFSGIGNIYKAEILYECKIHPNTLVRDLTSQQWNSINHTAHQILKAAYLSGGSSVRDYTADGQEGSYQYKLRVYGKKTCPKDHPVSQIPQGKRTTWYCATCQK